MQHRIFLESLSNEHIEFRNSELEYTRGAWQGWDPPCLHDVGNRGVPMERPVYCILQSHFRVLEFNKPLILFTNSIINNKS